MGSEMCIRDSPCSYDGAFVASIGEDKTIKVYDVEAIDLTRIIQLDYLPGPSAWVYNSPLRSLWIYVIHHI